MPLWRRLCIDLEYDNSVRGCSVEFHHTFDDEMAALTAYEASRWLGKTPNEVLADLIDNGWLDAPLPFPLKGSMKP